MSVPCTCIFLYATFENLELYVLFISFMFFKRWLTWSFCSQIKLPDLVGPLGAMQPFSYIRKLVFRSPWGIYFTPGFVCAQEYHSFPDTAFSGYQFTPWLSGALEIVGFAPGTSWSAVKCPTTRPMCPHNIISSVPAVFINNCLSAL